METRRFETDPDSNYDYGYREGKKKYSKAADKQSRKARPRSEQSAEPPTEESEKPLHLAGFPDWEELKRKYQNPDQKKSA